MLKLMTMKYICHPALNNLNKMKRGITRSMRRNQKRLYQPPPEQDYSKSYKRLIIVILISVVFIGGEIFAGLLANSIAIISDAIHLVSDLVSFIFSFLFLYLSKKPPTVKMSFGYHRMELLGALSNLFVIYILLFYVVYEATLRIMDKEFVEKPFVMLITAGAGLLVNIVMYKVLHGAGSHGHGLMSDPCNHDHEEKGVGSQEESQEYLGNQNYCDGSLCTDQLCNQSITYAHCHKNNSIHKHSSLEEPLLPDQKKTEKKQKKQKKEQQHHHHDHHHDHKHKDRHSSLGMQAVILHALTDMIMSIGVVISALVIFLLGNPNQYTDDVHQWNAWHLFDPISTFIFSIFTIFSTIPVIKNSYLLMMESTPSYIDVQAVQKQFEDIDGVIDVHDLHIWDLKPGKTCVIAHVFAKKDKERAVLVKLSDIVREQKIYHSTFQVEEAELKNDSAYIKCDHDIH